MGKKKYSLISEESLSYQSPAGGEEGEYEDWVPIWGTLDIINLIEKNYQN